MIKEIVKLFAVFGVMGGITIAPNLVKKEVEIFESNLDLPVVGTYENLKEIVAKSNENYNANRIYGNVYSISDFAIAEKGLMMQSNVSMDSAVAESASKSDYSETNVQVEGVDEADIVKTDGKYLYHLINNKLIISEIYPADKMDIVTEIKYDGDFTPIELYVEEEKVIIIGEEYEYKEKYFGENYTKIIVYNSKNKEKLEVEKEVVVSGRYNTSRKIEDSLYLVSQKSIRTYDFENEKYNPLPSYKDSAVFNELKDISCEDIRYFPEFKCSEYLIAVGIDLADLSKEANISTYLGSSESVYASKDNMYITFTTYKKDNVKPLEEEAMLRKILDDREYKKTTSIYRFKLKDGEMRCKATGEVDGSILNQFSMDEYDGYFRVATTVGEVTGIGENVSKNNMYVLDMDLNVVGAINDIAPGEKIYSVRYMGERAYMVTFRKVDPLFVIDLSSPKAPTILGKLKIPGYSDYLHPYDENHIIGFGKDAAVVNNEEGSWGWADENNTAAYYQGMKIALFDVTDPENPIEMWKEEIGDRGTESPLLNNHKALLFNKDKKLLAFPVQVATVNNKNSKAWTYGDTTFVGAYVYELTLDKGFILKAKLTDLTDEDWKKAGSYYYGDKTIDRLIYIDDALYTISDGGYTSYNIENFEKIDSLKIN